MTGEVKELFSAFVIKDPEIAQRSFFRALAVLIYFAIYDPAISPRYIIVFLFHRLSYVVSG